MNKVVLGFFFARRPWLLVLGLLASLLVVWGLAGCLMDGEDEVYQKVPWLVVLGGGVAGERDQLACQLYSQGHGRLGVVLTGGNMESFVSDRAVFLSRCGIPDALLTYWPAAANSYEEMLAVKRFLAVKPEVQVIIVSDALHMSRLRYLRDKLALKKRVLFRQSHLGGRWDMIYLSHVVQFWFREPLAYVYYRVRY